MSEKRVSRVKPGHFFSYWTLYSSFFSPRLKVLYVNKNINKLSNMKKKKKFFLYRLVSKGKKEFIESFDSFEEAYEAKKELAIEYGDSNLLIKEKFVLEDVEEIKEEGELLEEMILGDKAADEFETADLEGEILEDIIEEEKEEPKKVAVVIVEERKTTNDSLRMLVKREDPTVATAAKWIVVGGVLVLAGIATIAAINSNK